LCGIRIGRAHERATKSRCPVYRYLQQQFYCNNHYK
jgi:hypothetical protein